MGLQPPAFTDRGNVYSGAAVAADNILPILPVASAPQMRQRRAPRPALLYFDDENTKRLISRFHCKQVQVAVLTSLSGTRSSSFPAQMQAIACATAERSLLAHK